MLVILSELTVRRVGVPGGDSGAGERVRAHLMPLAKSLPRAASPRAWAVWILQALGLAGDTC